MANLWERMSLWMHGGWSKILATLGYLILLYLLYWSVIFGPLWERTVKYKDTVVLSVSNHFNLVGSLQANCCIWKRRKVPRFSAEKVVFGRWAQGAERTPNALLSYCCRVSCLRNTTRSLWTELTHLLRGVPLCHAGHTLVFLTSCWALWKRGPHLIENILGPWFKCAELN